MFAQFSKPQAHILLTVHVLAAAAALWNLILAHSWMPSQYFMGEVCQNWLSWRYLPCAPYIIHSHLLWLGSFVLTKDKMGDCNSVSAAQIQLFFASPVGYAALELHHFSIFILDHLYQCRARGWPLPKSLSWKHHLATFCTYWLLPGQVKNQRGV